MKYSSKILLLGSLGSLLLIFLCLYVNLEKFALKSETMSIEESNVAPDVITKSKPIINIEEPIRAIEPKAETELLKPSLLDYTIANQVLTIAGELPILENSDRLKIAMMKRCAVVTCERTIMFSKDQETPSWKRLAQEVIELFNDENVTLVDFTLSSERIHIDGELPSKRVKEKLLALITTYKGLNEVNDTTSIKEVIALKEELPKEKLVKKERQPVTNAPIESAKKVDDPILLAQDKINNLLKKKKVNFYRNRAKITNRGQRTLESIVAILKKIPNVIIEVQGHTDASGKAKINQWISEERAKSVKNYLGSRGLNPRDIRAKGFGETKLLLEDKPYSSLNRRVEIEIKRR